MHFQSSSQVLEDGDVGSSSAAHSQLKKQQWARKEKAFFDVPQETLLVTSDFDIRITYLTMGLYRTAAAPGRAGHM